MHITAYISYAVPLKKATGQDDRLIKDISISPFKALQSGQEPLSTQTTNFLFFINIRLHTLLQYAENKSRLAVI